jgi:hypothetical protein
VAGEARKTRRVRLIDLDKAPPPRAVRAALRVRRGLQRAADALVPPEVAAYETSISFFRTRVAGALTEVGVIDAIGDGRRDAADLAAELGLHADTLHRTLRLAATHGLTDIDAGGRFALTPMGHAFRSTSSPTLGPWVRHLNTEAVQRPWGELPETLRTGEPSFPAVHGKSIWQHFAENPEEERLFANSMRNMTALTLAWIVSGYPWPEHGVVADVAGGSGPVLAGVLGARPELRGMLVEAPGVLDEADGHLRRAGVRDRVELAEGNIFERIDAEADLYVLKDILHDWDDERSLQILRTVAAAMRPGSKLVLVEQLLERNEADPIAASVDLHMLAQCDGGRQRSQAELEDLIRAAGLRPGETHRTGGPAMVEALA